MKQKEIFSLAVRLLGLVFLYHGLSVLPGVLPMIFSPGSVGNFVGGILMLGWPLVVAYWLVRGGTPLVRIAYPDSEG
jgi:hypothetical protein